MARKRHLVVRLAALGLVALGACVWGDGDSEPDAFEGREGLTPKFEATTTTDRPGGGGSTSTTAGAVASTTSTSVGGAGAVSARPSATLTDPVGDATDASGGQPRWADLVGATLTAQEQYFELRVRFGDPAPSASGSADKTMNVATFFDVDGDGFVDYEVWANLADGGWDGAWFDNRDDAALFSEDAAMDVRVTGSELSVRFPPEHLGMAKTFRWSLALEYGGYGILGTADTAQDEAPDDGKAVLFPQ